MSASCYRILSLDGGGTWALVQAIALGEIYGYETPGHDILRSFDLVAGTSGGSLTLGGLVAGRTPSKLLQLFEDQRNREQIFVTRSFLRPRHSSRWRILAEGLARFVAGVGPKYDTTSKYEGICKLLGSLAGVPMSELPGRIGANWQGRRTHLLITAFDYDLNRSSFFRSNLESRASSRQLTAHDRPPRNERDPRLAQAIHASTNAPVDYFDLPAEMKGKGYTARYWDGAIAALNNPVTAALIEVMVNSDDYASQGPHGAIHVLSLGTGTVSRWSEIEVRAAYQDRHILDLDARIRDWVEDELVSPLDRPRFSHDLRQLASSVLDDPPDQASFVAHVMLRQPLPDPATLAGEALPSTIVRMSPVARPDWDKHAVTIRLPEGMKEDDWISLINLTMDAIEQADVAQIDRLARLWVRGAVANQPIRESRKGSDGAECLIGWRTFEAAKEAWLRLAGPAGQSKPPV